MKYYELTYLASPELSGEELSSLSSKISAFIAEQGGGLKELSEPVRKRISQSIKKRKEAFLITSNFYSTPEKINDLEKKLKKENAILRYLIIAKILKIAPKRIIKPATLKINDEKLSPPVRKAEKIELKEIDKKIEEILKE